MPQVSHEQAALASCVDLSVEAHANSRPETSTLDIACRCCPDRLVLAPAAASLRRVRSRSEEASHLEAALVEVSWV